jgi:hypothetical protein
MFLHKSLPTHLTGEKKIFFYSESNNQVHEHKQHVMFRQYILRVFSYVALISEIDSRIGDHIVGILDE